jgi:Domain of unknown function (DUF4381)
MKPDWLAQLAPAHAPPPPGWWPPAPGWWGLALLLLLGLAALLVGLNRPPRRLRRVALRQLARLEQGSHDDADLAHELENLLRRYAVARFGRETVAGLAGAAWIDFVVAHGGTDWKGDTGAHLLRAAYGGLTEGDRTRWLAGARGFIKGRA